MSAADPHGSTPGTAPPPSRLRKRGDFLRAARGRRFAASGFILQARPRGAADPDAAAGDIRVGFTCSRKVGGAVARNHAKRRLREIARRVFPRAGRAGWDYVLIGRRVATTKVPFETLEHDLRRGLARIHGTA